MILLGMLIILSSLMLMLMAMFGSHILELKINTLLVHRQKQFYELESALLQIQHRFTDARHSLCVIREKDYKLSIPEYRKPGCHINVAEKAVYYVVVDLGEEPCLKALNDGQLIATRHWLITVFNSSDAIQARYAQYDASTSLCLKSKSKVISVGQLSWRYISF
tara:strand:- start:980 stop:1471 length:492 start_codon:yes stop_codon:yes gene_type:complete